MTARGLDHIVHAVSDLDAAAEFYRRCGFQVGARNRHPWGTHNHIVQLPGFFIEILTVAEPDKLGFDGLSRHFGAFQRDAIARRDGFSMLAVESTGIADDVADFRRTDIGITEALPFERGATLPDGTPTTIGFSLVFARDPHAPDVGFAACRQHSPQVFWNAAYQRHPNGVSALNGVVLVAQQPLEHLDFLRNLTGTSDVETRAEGLFVPTPRGTIEVQQPTVFAQRFGNRQDHVEGASLAGLRMAADSLDALAKRLQDETLPALRSGARLVVPPTTAFGATLIFEQAALS